MSEKESKAPKERGLVGKFFKSFVDLKKWVSYDEISSNTKNTVGFFRRLFSSQHKEVRHESYEEAISRMGLNDEQIAKRKKIFLQSAMIYGGFALGFVIYFVYLMINLRLLAASLTLIIIALMVVTAYREHFWYMQMDKKKLGCDFHDWIAFILRRDSK